MVETRRQGDEAGLPAVMISLPVARVWATWVTQDMGCYESNVKHADPMTLAEDSVTTIFATYGRDALPEPTFFACLCARLGRGETCDDYTFDLYEQLAARNFIMVDEEQEVVYYIGPEPSEPHRW